MGASVLIVAAGRGRRFGAETPKQYLPVDGTCALRRSIETFLSLSEVSVLQVVFHPDDETLYADALHGLDDTRLRPPVPGGETRVASVAAGLAALTPFAPDSVLVHDAARPFVSPRIIRDVLKALAHGPAAFPALPVVDALWRGDDGHAVAPVLRDGLWRAQTPQGFRFDTLVRAHASYDGDAADDVEIARAMGVAVRIVPGAEENFKITTAEDLDRANRLARQLA